ncbi:hypothetical protein, partial [Sinorhizobium meliloti]|uniref:hypothetical protein n=1 Tax=Rhizobium meliloti TaxID=382 RepID=UPI001AEC7CBE
MMNGAPATSGNQGFCRKPAASAAKSGITKILRLIQSIIALSPEGGRGFFPAGGASPNLPSGIEECEQEEAEEESADMRLPG